MIPPNNENEESEQEEETTGQAACSAEQQPTETIPTRLIASPTRDQQDTPWLPVIQALTMACAEATGQANATAMTVLLCLHEHQQLFENALHGIREKLKET